MFPLCAESSEARLGSTVFADGGCFLIAQVAEAGLENSSSIIPAYLPVTRGFQQIKTFVAIVCRCKPQLAVETRADHLHLGSPRCPLLCATPLPDGLSAGMVRDRSFCQVTTCPATTWPLLTSAAVSDPFLHWP